MARPERKLPPDLDILAHLRALPLRWRRRAVEMLGPLERHTVDRYWPNWAHEGQRPPDPGADGSDWRVWVLMAGRGFGKTRAGAEWIADSIAGGEPLKIALVGATLEDARRVMIEEQSGLLEVAGDMVAEWSPTLRRLRFRSGAEAHLFSGASPDQLRGPQHHLAWCDELAKWKKPGETWDMLQLGLRAGAHPRVLVTTTPRPGPHLKRIMASPHCVVTGGPTHANPHLPKVFRDNVAALYAGTRLGRQELNGELLPDVPGALWTVELLEKCRIPTPLPGREGQGVGTSEARTPPGMESASAASNRLTADPPPTPPWERGVHPHESTTFGRVVIGVDPPSGDGTCGIVACAKDGKGRAHVLADHSVTGRSPEGWARAVAAAAQVWSIPLRNGEGDRAERGGGAPLPVLIVAEANQGGRMVESVLRAASADLRVKLVHAADGKTARADPVSTLFEAGKVALHGRWPELEAQLCGMIGGGGYEGPGASPDRADAMVWALTELMLQKEQPEPRIRRL